MSDDNAKLSLAVLNEKLRKLSRYPSTYDLYFQNMIRILAYIYSYEPKHTAQMLPLAYCIL